MKMSEWINCKIAKPPESHSVLLYVVTFHEDGKNIWSENICVGFYGDEDYDENGYYIEILNDSTCNFKILKETDQFKVLAWTLLPRRPYKEIFDDIDGMPWSV
jgi:hypothetical protein